MGEGSVGLGAMSEIGRRYLPPTAMSLVRVRKSNVPSEIAGVAMQVSPRSLVAATEN